jgi:hypothetical protein
MITSEKVKKLVELFEADSGLTSLSCQTGYGFLMDGEVPKFDRIESRYGPRIIHPLYLYITHWGGRDLQVYLSLKLTPLVVDQSELDRRPKFEYWVPGKGSPVVVKRYLTPEEYVNDASLEAVIREMLGECARIYLLYCQE